MYWAMNEMIRREGVEQIMFVHVLKRGKILHFVREVGFNYINKEQGVLHVLHFARAACDGDKYIPGTHTKDLSKRGSM